jgi:hypothetical protein
MFCVFFQCGRTLSATVRAHYASLVKAAAGFEIVGKENLMEDRDNGFPRDISHLKTGLKWVRLGSFWVCSGVFRSPPYFRKGIVIRDLRKTGLGLFPRIFFAPAFLRFEKPAANKQASVNMQYGQVLSLGVCRFILLLPVKRIDFPVCRLYSDNTTGAPFRAVSR